MIKYLRQQRRMKMEQLGGSGKFNPVHEKDPYAKNIDTPNAYAHRRNVQEVLSSMASGLGGRFNPKRAAFPSKLGNLGARSGWARSNTQQGRSPQKYGNTPRGMAEAEEDMGPTKTGQKGKRQIKVNLNPEHDETKIF